MRVKLYNVYSYHSAWLTISSSVLGGAILEVVVGGGDAEGEGLTQAVSVGLEGGH